MIDIASTGMTLKDLGEIEAAACRESFWSFVRRAWHTVEPGQHYVDGWHIGVICAHLEAVSRGEIHNLIINIPPRCTKSLLLCVFWPAWIWTWAPEKKFLFVSYAATLSVRDSIKCRMVIESPWYQRLFGHGFQLSESQNKRDNYLNTAGGQRISSSIGGTVTGEGGDFCAADDPHNVEQALSEHVRGTTLRWFDETWPTRLNNPQSGGRVVIMQRLHEQDVTGHLMETGDYELLVLPMEFESDRNCVTSLGIPDQRTQEGELLWPERFGEKALSGLKTPLGTYGVAGQLQQRPVPRGGGMFKRTAFKECAMAPERTNWCRYWDLAGTEPSIDRRQRLPDATAGALVGLGPDNRIYVGDMKHFRATSLDVERCVRATAEEDGPNVMVCVEQEPGASGKHVAEYYTRNVLLGFNVRCFKPGVGKTKAWGAEPLAAQAEAGNVYLVRGPWMEKFLREAEIFPNGTYDDQVDAVTGGFHVIIKKRKPLTWGAKTR